jgi:DNA-binding transcriptional LysR family regulator
VPKTAPPIYKGQLEQSEPYMKKRNSKSGSTDRIGRQLKLRHLHMLQVIATRGSMARAADELALSQPAISKAIADLEHDLGVALLSRSSRGAELTPSGKVLVRRGRVIFDELKQALHEIENLSDPTVGEVRIGAVESLSPFISTIIERTSRHYPKITYRVMFGDVSSLIKATRDRALDLVIARAILAESETDLNAEILFRDRIVVVVAHTHPLARRKKVALLDLLDESWALGPADTFLGQFLLKAFRAQGLPMPRTVVTTISIQSRLDMMETGRFVTVYSGAMMSHPTRRGRFKVLPVDLNDTAGPMAAITLKVRQAPAALKLVMSEMRTIAKAIAATE